MSTSTLQTLGVQAINYTWDSVTGLLYTAGLMNFWVALTIILGVITIAIVLLRGVFGMK